MATIDTLRQHILDSLEALLLKRDSTIQSGNTPSDKLALLEVYNKENSELLDSLELIEKSEKTISLGTLAQDILTLEQTITVADTGWVSLTPYLANTWVEHATQNSPRYRKIGNTVFMDGLIKSGTNGTYLENIPTEIIPARIVYHNSFFQQLSNTAINYSVIEPNGSVSSFFNGTVPVAGWVSLNIVYTTL